MSDVILEYIIWNGYEVPSDEVYTL